MKQAEGSQMLAVHGTCFVPALWTKETLGKTFLPFIFMLRKQMAKPLI